MVTGSLQIKNDVFYAVLNIADENGKRKQKWISTKLHVKGNKRKAEAMLAQLKYEYEHPAAVQGDQADMLFVDYLQKWLKAMKPHLQESTFNDYRGKINGRIDRFFRPRQLALGEVRAAHLEEMYGEIIEQGFTANTALHYHAIARKALQMAVRDEIIPCNPADKVERPKKAKFVGDYYNKEEVELLLAAIKGDPLAALVEVTAYYGFRRSEVVGLRWKAVNFQQKTITVSHKVLEMRRDGKTMLEGYDKTKTESSYRTLPLIPRIEELLLCLKQRQTVMQRLARNSYCKDYAEYIFVNDLGTLSRPNYVTAHFAWLLEHYNLRRIRFHDLRHSCASLLLHEGVKLKVIQEWLGHSTLATTADIYAHLDYEAKIEAADAMQDLFS